MAYVETIKRGKKHYYYLTKNIRLSLNKWKKVRAYMGDEEPSAARVEKYAKKLEAKIKKEGMQRVSPYPHLGDHDAETLQDLKESYAAWLKRMPPRVKEKLNEDFVIRFTYNTNAIEGNRLTLRQTALILKDNVIPSGVRAQDYNEALNGKECLDYLKGYGKDFNLRLLTSINRVLTKNTGVIYPGRVRFFEVRIEGSKHTPQKHEEVKRHLQNLLRWYCSNRKRLHPFELATLVHAKLTWIHPFEDGNGRTARAMMNFILMKRGYPMFFIPNEKREAYYATLEAADRGDYKTYVAGMLQLTIDQIRSYGHKEEK